MWRPIKETDTEVVFNVDVGIKMRRKGNPCHDYVDAVINNGEDSHLTYNKELKMWSYKGHRIYLDIPGLNTDEVITYITSASTSERTLYAHMGDPITRKTKILPFKVVVSITCINPAPVFHSYSDYVDREYIVDVDNERIIRREPGSSELLESSLDIIEKLIEGHTDFDLSELKSLHYDISKHLRD